MVLDALGIKVTLMHTHSLRVFFAVFALLALAPMAEAGFDRFVDENCSDESNCYYWRPKVAPVRGWHRDDDASKSNLANVLVPDGETYDSAKTVIYVRAIARETLGDDSKSIPGVMAKDREDMERNWPGTAVAAGSVLKSGDGQSLKSQTFTPVAGAQNRWERTAYGKEGKFFLQFTLSADSAAGLAAGMKDFERTVASYKAKMR